MKFALLAATALAFAAPAYAQDTTTAPPPEDPTMSTTAPETQTPPNTSTTPTDPMSQTPSSDPMSQTPSSDPMAGSMSSTGTGTMTNGGYAPSTPPMAGAPQPGAQVVFRPSAPVSQAFPPPPAKESYPTCTRSVKDGCRNPGGQ
jgi:hypothetical protein